MESSGEPLEASSGRDDDTSGIVEKKDAENTPFAVT